MVKSQGNIKTPDDTTLEVLEREIGMLDDMCDVRSWLGMGESEALL